MINPAELVNEGGDGPMIVHFRWLRWPNPDGTIGERFQVTPVTISPWEQEPERVLAECVADDLHRETSAELDGLCADMADRAVYTASGFEVARFELTEAEVDL